MIQGNKDQSSQVEFHIFGHKTKAHLRSSMYH